MTSLREPDLDCGCLCGEQSATVERSSGDGFQSAAIKVFVDGQSADHRTAVQRGAEILQNSRCPVIFGMGASSVPTVRAAVHLAEMARGVIDPVSTTFSRAWGLATQERGVPTLTLGELRDRADVVILWGADPAQTHPSFVERFLSPPLSLNARPRQVIRVKTSGESGGGDQSDSLTIPESGVWEAVRRLRSLCRQRRSSSSAAPPRIASPVDELCEALFRSQYAVVCFDLPSSSITQTRQICEEFILLADELNEGRRCSLLPMLSQRTAETVLAWQTGFPGAVSFRSGMPEHDDSRWHANSLLEQGAADCLVLVDDGGSQLSTAARAKIQNLPVIQIGGPRREVGIDPCVRWVLPVLPGGDPGTRYRMDGVPVSLASGPTSARSLPATILDEIRDLLAQPR